MFDAFAPDGSSIWPVKAHYSPSPRKVLIRKKWIPIDTCWRGIMVVLSWNICLGMRCGQSSDLLRLVCPELGGWLVKLWQRLALLKFYRAQIA